MIKDFAKYSVSNIRKRRLRSWLTMLGIFIGIAAVVALVSLGQGFQKFIDEEFEKLGRDILLITPKGQLGATGEGSANLTKSDLDAVKGVIGVLDANGMVFKSARVEFNDIVRYQFLLGMPTGKEGRVIRQIFSNYGIEKGRELRKGDKRKAVLGHNYLDRELFERNVKLGDKILINDVPFDVVGFYSIIGNPEDDKNIYTSEDQLFEMFDIENEQDVIYARAAATEDVSVVADRIEKGLRKHRNLEEGDEDFNVETPQELVKTFLAIVDIVQVVMIGIAAISLLVGGIGIMNTMFTAVLERTNEIGVMKSIGAKNSDILAVFLIESGLLGLIGGVIGIAIGMGIAKSVELAATIALQTTLLKAFFPWYLVLGALVFAFVVGALAGLLPAVMASKMSPVDALRYE